MLSRLGARRFDVLVIGGGITGCGVALDAASRGLSVALVERDDFGSGTSSKSSKLIHGGLRYLQQRDFRLVYEALREADAHGERSWEPEVHRLRGKALAATGDTAEAEDSFLRALELAQGQGERTFELQAAMGLARLLQDQDRSDEAREVLAPVVAWFTEGLDTPLLVGARELLDGLGATVQNE